MLKKDKDKDNLLLDYDIDESITNGSFPSPITYQYYKKLKNNIIVFNDEVTEDIIETAVLPLMDMDKNPNVKEINIIMNTIGGSVYHGFTIVNILEHLTTPTTLRIMGMAASMGALIAMAKNPKYLKVVCDEFTVGLIHSGSTYMEGTTHAVKDTFKFSERYEEKIKQYILSHTKITPEMYDQIERQEFWMDADDMLKYGIVDEII
jgi:ATP-dependent Clp protease protease subunit